MVLPPRTHGTPALRVRGCIGCRTKQSVRAPPRPGRPLPAPPGPWRQAMRARTRMAGGGTRSALITCSASPTERGSRVLDGPAAENPRDTGLTSPWMHRLPDEAVRTGTALVRAAHCRPRPARGGKRCSHGLAWPVAAVRWAGQGDEGVAAGPPRRPRAARRRSPVPGPAPDRTCRRRRPRQAQGSPTGSALV